MTRERQRIVEKEFDITIRRTLATSIQVKILTEICLFPRRACLRNLEIHLFHLRSVDVSAL